MLGTDRYDRKWFAAMASIRVVEEFDVCCLKYGNTYKVCEYTCADECKLFAKSAAVVTCVYVFVLVPSSHSASFSL